MTPEELAAAIQNRYPTGDLITGGTFLRAELAKLIRENMPTTETNDRKQQTLSDGRIVSIANTLLEEFLILKHGKPARWQTIADVIRREIARYNGQPDPEPAPTIEDGPASYHFDIGNSNDGALGMCARVTADSKAEAVTKLRAYLNSLIDGENLPPMDEHPDVEYCTVYFGEQHITDADIDEAD